MTTEEKKIALIKSLGLEMGSLIRFENRFDNQTFMVCELNNEIILQSTALTTSAFHLNVYYLIAYDWVKIKKPLKNGDVLCKDWTCSYCPLRIFDCDIVGDVDKPLYELLDCIFDVRNFAKNSKIYKTIKEDLDKVYVEK